MENHCKNCKFWRQPEKGTHGKCDRIDIAAGKPTDKAEIDVFVHDDSGLMANLITAPDFGCTLHLLKQ